MKILYFDLTIPFVIKDTTKPAGGASVEWMSWIKGFNQNDVEVGVLTWKGAQKYLEDVSLNFKIIEGFDKNKGMPKFRWLTYRFPTLLKAVKDYSPNFLIQECANMYTGIFAIIAKILKIPFVYRVANDMDTDNRYKSKLALVDQIFYKFGLARADYIICQNSYQYEQLRNKFPQKKITILYNPFEVKKENGTNYLERKYIAWVGIFQYQKNLPGLLEVTKRLPNINFKIAGKTDSNIDDNSQKAIEQLKKLDNVEFVGFITRNEISDFLKNSIALLNTSHFEGFSNTFLEAWSVGIPIITTQNVNPDNLINKYDLGLVAANIEEIPSLINKISNSTDLEKYSNKCKQYVEKNHAPDYLSKKFIDFLTN